MLAGVSPDTNVVLHTSLHMIHPTGRTSLKRCARDLGVPKWPYKRHKVNDLGQGTKGHAGAGAGEEAAVAASVKSINSFDFASLDEAQRCKLNERATELQKESDEYVHLG